MTLATTTPWWLPAHRDEATAIQIAMYGSTVARLRVGVSAIVHLLHNPDDTGQAFVLAAALDRDHLPKPFFRFMTDAIGFELMRDQPAIDSTSIDYQALAALPPGTLGHAYARHLLDQGLDPDLFQAPPSVPRAIAYLAKRFRQTHDIWHVLTGYATDVQGEVLLQAFAFGQLGTPAPGLIAVAGAIRCSLRDPLAVLRAWKAYRRGKRARFLLVVRFEDFWDEPLAQVRARLEVEAARS
jgi:ubiquinone biosynthesis protein COQ4